MEPLRAIKTRKKHGCLISFITVIAVCVLIGAFASRFTPATDSNTSSLANSSDSSGLQNVPAKIGAEISNKKVAIKINSVKEASSMSDATGYMTYTPDTGGKFVVVNLTAKNVGNELYSFTVNNFQVKSSDGKQYSPSTMFTAENYLNSGSINPGLSKTGNICFEVPKEVKLSALTLEFTEFLSFDAADFSLSEE